MAALVTPQPQREIAALGCAERLRLLEEFTDAVRDLALVQDQQIAALLLGHEDCSQLEALLHRANEKRSHAKYAYMQHALEHGCVE